MLKQKTPPTARDFSSSAINKVVYKRGLTHWLSLYPPALGIPVGVAGLLFNSPLVCAIGFGACFVSLGNAVINIFFKNEKIAGNYIEELNRRLKEQESLVLTSLEENLKQCTTIAGVEPLALQSVDQFKKVRLKYKNVHDLLEQKFNSGEMTFGRFLGAAEQVYLSALDNLKQIVSTLQSVSSIDLEYVKKNLRKLSEKKNPNAADIKEMEALKKRLSLWRQQVQKVDDLLSNNEEAMTELEAATAAIAALNTGGSFASTDFETALDQLQELAQRSQIYNKQ